MEDFFEDDNLEATLVSTKKSPDKKARASLRLTSSSNRGRCGYSIHYRRGQRQGLRYFGHKRHGDHKRNTGARTKGQVFGLLLSRIILGAVLKVYHITG